MDKWTGRDISGEATVHVRPGRRCVWVSLWHDGIEIKRLLPLVTAREMAYAILNARDEAMHPSSDDDPPCSGSGVAHSAHGNCPGYTYDRT